MTVEAVSWVWEARTSRPLDKLILIKLADSYWKDPVWIDLQQHADFCGVSVSDIEDAVERLVDDGFLSRNGEDKYWLTNFLPFGCVRTPQGIVEAPNPRPAYVKKQISQGLRMRVFERDGFTCKVCGVKEKLTVDHIHPEAKGGTLEFGNLQTLCKPCNSRKRDRLP
jgi:hypothetical protein